MPSTTAWTRSCWRARRRRARSRWSPCETLDAIIREAEQLPPLAVTSTGRLMHAEHGRALCEAAVTLADRGHATAIVAVTRGGNTARMLATFRPQAAILAATSLADVARRLLLYRGVVPIVTPLGEDVDATGDAIGRELMSRGLVPFGRRGRLRQRARGPAAARGEFPEAASGQVAAERL